MSSIRDLINSDTSQVSRADLIDLIDTLRIDAILGESDHFDQDELGKILALLGAEGYEGIYD